MALDCTIEYKVIPVTRYMVTRFYSSKDESVKSGTTDRGEYNNEEVAFQVAYALCRAEHEQLGWDVGDERIVYPKTYEQQKLAIAARRVAKL